MRIVFHPAGLALATLGLALFYVLWYSPWVFGRLWARLDALPEEELDRGLWSRLGLALAAAAAQAFCLDGFMSFTGTQTFLQGALLGLQLGLGLSLPALAVALAMARRPWSLLGLHAGWALLSLALGAGLLGALR